METAIVVVVVLVAAAYTGHYLYRVVKGRRAPCSCPNSGACESARAGKGGPCAESPEKKPAAGTSDCRPNGD